MREGIQIGFQGDVLLSIHNLPVFPNISKTFIFMLTGVKFSSHNVFLVEQQW